MIPDEQLQALAQSDDFITHDGLMDRLLDREDIRYYKRDFLYRSGKWRDNHVKSAISAITHERVRTIIIGHSDYSFSTAAWVPFRLTGVSGALVSNTTTPCSRVRPLPLGLTNDCDDGPLHRLLGDREPLKTVVEEGRRTIGYRGVKYANFNPKTHKSRRRLQQLLNENPVTSIESPDYSRDGRISYLRSLRDSDFVLCPRGNGIDTHRLWETLYVGGLPVVEEFPRARELLQGLPAIIVRDWSNITNSAFMERSWYEMHENTHSAERLTLSYYANLAVRISINPQLIT